MSVDDPQAFAADANVATALRLAFADLLRVPAEYITIDSADAVGGRRLGGGAGRELAAGTGTVRVQFTIAFPWDAGSDADSRAAAVNVTLSEVVAGLGGLSPANLTSAVRSALDTVAGPGTYVFEVTVVQESVVSFVTLTTTTLTTTTTTTRPCGDGLRESYEWDSDRCDDGNTISGDGCDAACFVEHGWYCHGEGQPCSTICGDGLVAAPRETCDDGNAEPCDGCSDRCLLEPGRCELQAAALCVEGYERKPDLGPCDFCRGDVCRPSECCVLARRAPPAPVCGDGRVTGEELASGRCDDGNAVAGDGCDESCFVEPGWYCRAAGSPCETVCGDGVVAWPAEGCDDGNAEELDDCTASCELARGRCHAQAADVCVGGWSMRADVPPTALCRGRRCTAAECCFPAPEALEAPEVACPARLGGSPTTACAEGHARPVWRRPADNGAMRGADYGGVVAPGVPQAAQETCAAFACPAGWSPRQPRPETIVCQDPLCRLARCCDAPSAACVCADDRCCAPPQRPPALVDDVGRAGGFRLSLVAPTVAFVRGRVRWYYYLSAGAVTAADLDAALGPGGVAESKGYEISLPSVGDLQALFALQPALEVPVGGGPEPLPAHLWTSTPAPAVPGAAARWALRHKAGEQAAAYAEASLSERKHALLEVAEVLTVTHSAGRLTRLPLADGSPCCLGGDRRQRLAGLPGELLGATLFMLDGDLRTRRRPGLFTLQVGAAATVFALAAVDPYNKHGGLYDSGFQALGWERLPAAAFRLEPAGVWMACWRATLLPGAVLEVPHAPGLFGSVAVSVGAAHA